MSKEIGYFAKLYARDRNEIRAIAERLLPPEKIKRSKGLMWIEEDAALDFEKALLLPEHPKSFDPNIITVLVRPGAQNPRFEYGQTVDGEKIGFLIPSGAKGRHVGKKVSVEVFTCNDGIKTYRLSCAKLNKLTS